MKMTKSIEIEALRERVEGLEKRISAATEIQEILTEAVKKAIAALEGIDGRRVGLARDVLVEAVKHEIEYQNRMSRLFNGIE